MRYIFVYLRREIDRLAKQADVPWGESPRSFRNAFRLGAVSEVLRRMKIDRREQRQEVVSAGKASTALVFVDRKDALAEDRVKEISKGKVHRGGRPTSAAGLFAGRKAGSKIAIQQGLGEGGDSRGSLN